MYQCIEKQIHSDLNIVKETVNEILLDIDVELNNEYSFIIKLVLSELVINCVKHGNKNNTNKLIYIKLDIYDDRIIISVQDEGKGIKYNNNPDTLSESGRGLMLVKGLTDKMIIDNNTVICFIYL